MSEFSKSNRDLTPAPKIRRNRPPSKMPSETTNTALSPRTETFAERASNNDIFGYAYYRRLMVYVRRSMPSEADEIPKFRRKFRNTRRS